MARGKKRGVAKRGKAKKAKITAKKIAKQAKPIELYYWPTPNGFKISIMLEECGLPYVLKPVNISKGEQFNPDFLKIAPNNRMPAIVDPQGPGGRPISIFESGAILQYLGRKTGKFYPSEERARVEVDQWLFWQMGGLGPMAGQLNHFKHYARETLGYAIKRYDDEVNRLYGVMNTPPERPAVPCRKIFNRRYGMRGLGQSLAAARAGHRTISELETVAGNGESTAGREARHGARSRVASRHRHEGSKRSIGAFQPASPRGLKPIEKAAPPDDRGIVWWLVAAERVGLANGQPERKTGRLPQ